MDGWFPSFYVSHYQLTMHTHACITRYAVTASHIIKRCSAASTSLPPFTFVSSIHHTRRSSTHTHAHTSIRTPHTRTLTSSATSRPIIMSSTPPSSPPPSSTF